MTVTPDSHRSPATGGWEELLDRLEADLAALDAMLDDGEVVPLPLWAPPSDLGPVPAELRDRVGELSRRFGRAQERTRERLTALAAELHDVRRQRRAGEAYATSF